jgi:hypothetical protein
VADERRGVQARARPERFCQEIELLAAGEEFRGVHELPEQLVQPFGYWNQVLIPQRRAQGAKYPYSIPVGRHEFTVGDAHLFLVRHDHGRRSGRSSLPRRARGGVGSFAGGVKQVLRARACSHGGMLTAVRSSRRHSLIAVAVMAKARPPGDGRGTAEQYR